MQTSYGAKFLGVTLPRKIDLWRVKAGGKQMSFQNSFNHSLLNESASEIQLLEHSISCYPVYAIIPKMWLILTDEVLFLISLS